MSTWFDASTGTLVSWLTGIASSFTFSRLAYSLARSHAGPLHAAPCPVVFSTSHGAFASTPMRSTSAFLMASIRGLVPGAGTGTSARTGAHSTSAHSARQRTRHWDMVSFRQRIADAPASGSAGHDDRREVAACQIAIRAGVALT